MNLQSNALKFTKSGGSIRIIAQMIKGMEPNQKVGARTTLQRIYQDSFSSESSSGSDDLKSEVSQFDKRHSIERIFEPEYGKDKLVISVIDTGIGIKKKDRIKLFKLFGCL